MCIHSAVCDKCQFSWTDLIQRARTHVDLQPLRRLSAQRTAQFFLSILQIRVGRGVKKCWISTTFERSLAPHNYFTN